MPPEEIDIGYELPPVRIATGDPKEADSLVKVPEKLPEQPFNVALMVSVPSVVQLIFPHAKCPPPLECRYIGNLPLELFVKVSPIVNEPLLNIFNFAL